MPGDREAEIIAVPGEKDIHFIPVETFFAIADAEFPDRPSPGICFEIVQGPLNIAYVADMSVVVGVAA